jgi:uncharacterized damage-inducible protein DinB/predicted RNase H-like HicB family nuclease
MPFIIHRKPPYRVYVEAGSEGAMAHVAELPGCFGTGSSAPRALAAVPGAIAEFLVWLRSRREPIVPEAHVSRPTVADLYVAEVRREGAPLIAGSRAALFDCDTAPWPGDRFERALRWLGYSRADLVSATAGHSEDELRATAVAPGRTVRDTLQHIAHAEYGYIDRVAGPLEGIEVVTEDFPTAVADRLDAVREIFLRRLETIPPERRGEVVYAPWAARPDEPWTAQKTLRRAIEHELEHLRELEKNG